MCALLITELLQLVARLGSVNRFHRTSWLPVASPTDRSKSARNRGVIEVFGGVFVLSLSCFSLNIFYSELKGMLHKYAKFIPNKGFEKKTPKCVFILIHLPGGIGTVCTGQVQCPVERDGRSPQKAEPGRQSPTAVTDEAFRLKAGLLC